MEVIHFDFANYKATSQTAKQKLKTQINLTYEFFEMFLFLLQVYPNLYFKMFEFRLLHKVPDTRRDF